MAGKNIPYYNLGFHGNTSRRVPSMSPPPLLLDEEAQHLVYVFCDTDNSTKTRHKHGYQRRYCSLCRHFHQENGYKEGFETEYFSNRETFKKNKTGRNEEEKMDLRTSGDSARGLQANAAFVSSEKTWRTLSIEGLKLYKTPARSTQKSISRQPELGKVADLHLKGESDHKQVSARSGCKVCVKGIDSSHKKKIIKIVVPPFD